MRSELVDENNIPVNSIFSLLKIEGKDSIGFLNNFLISNLPKLTLKKFHYTALCNPKGRVISSFWIYIIANDKQLLICPKNLHITIIDYFNSRKFRQIFTISIEDIAVTINNNTKLIELDEDKTSISQQLFYTYLFSLNLAWIDEENTEKYIPQHINLDQHPNIMSFSKGCYPGQEIIARLKYLGKIKKNMITIKADKKSLLNEKIANNQCVSPVIFLKDENQYAIQVIQQI